MPPAPTIAPPAKNYGLADKLQIAYTANVALESEKVQEVTEGVEVLFQHEDGFVLTSQYQRGSATQFALATVTGRVPAARLGDMLLKLDGLGTLLSRSVNGEDLTAAHLAQMESLGNLQQNAQHLSDISGTTRRTGESLHVEDERDKTAQDLPACAWTSIS